MRLIKDTVARIFPKVSHGFEMKATNSETLYSNIFNWKYINEYKDTQYR